MAQSKGGIRLDQPNQYEIRIQGRLEENWSRWFDDMDITVESQASGPTVTILSGMVTDQAALHGLLNRIRDLGIPLLSVQLKSPELQRGGGDETMSESH